MFEGRGGNEDEYSVFVSTYLRPVLLGATTALSSTPCATPIIAALLSQISANSGGILSASPLLLKRSHAQLRETVRQHHGSQGGAFMPKAGISLRQKYCEFCFKYTRRASYNLLITQVAPNVSHKFQYVPYQTLNSITPGSTHCLQK